MMARSVEMMESVRVEDIVSEVSGASCGDCGEMISGVQDDDGMWISCDCDAGYAQSSTIMAIVHW